MPVASLRERIWRYRVDLAIVGVGFLAINAIFLAGAFREADAVSAVGAGQLGDFVGGYVGTLFALVSVVLLVRTLRSQHESARLLNFETKYFELIGLHRDNVAELELAGSRGRRVFVMLIREYRSIHDLVVQLAQQRGHELSQRQVAHISYNCLLFGTGPNSSRQLAHSLSKYDRSLIDAILNEFEKLDVKRRVQAQRRLDYVPFEGHQSRLGHYYRHLYQAIKYVDQQHVEIDKYEYVKTIRAQLSNHEQALLLVNSLSPIGENWWTNEFIDGYKLVQNLPQDFFNPNTELDVSKLFSDGYFEWQESRITAG